VILERKGNVLLGGGERNGAISSEDARRVARPELAAEHRLFDLPERQRTVGERHE
jgi:hypothetical protein